MTSAFLRVSALAFAFSLLAGCGGSSGGNGGGGGGGGNPIEVTFTFAGGTPSAVATQIGSGAYTQATVESGQLTLSIPGGETNYSVAYMCPGTVAVTSGVASGERVILASIQDGTPVRMICAGSSSIQLGMATVQVNAAAIPGAAYVFAGPYQQEWSGGTLSFSNEMLSGTHEVAVYAVNASFNALAVRILRNQTIPGTLNGGNPALLGSGDLTVPQTITYHNVPSGFSAPLTNAQYLSAGGASVSLSQGETAQYPAIPAGEVQSGDDYAFSAGARSTTTPSEYMFVNKPPRSSGGPQTFTFPAPWSYA